MEKRNNYSSVKTIITTNNIDSKVPTTYKGRSRNIRVQLTVRITHVVAYAV